MKRLRMIGLALAAVCFAAQADAEELSGTLRKIRETGVINIGYRDSSIPFSYLDDNQKPIGFAIEGPSAHDRVPLHVSQCVIRLPGKLRRLSERFLCPAS